MGISTELDNRTKKGFSVGLVIFLYNTPGCMKWSQRNADKIVDLKKYSFESEARTREKELYKDSQLILTGKTELIIEDSHFILSGSDWSP